MNTMLRYGLGIVVVSFMSAAFADKADDEDNAVGNPIGCRNVGYTYVLHTIQLHPEAAGKKDSMYVFYNQSPATITLYQMRDDDETSRMFFNHQIGPKEWGVFSMSEQKAKYLCTVDAKGAFGRPVDCATVLKVCEYDHVHYGLNNRGNYWLVNSSTRGAMVNSIVHYGVIPGA